MGALLSVIVDCRLYLFAWGVINVSVDFEGVESGYCIGGIQGRAEGCPSFQCF